MSGCKCCEDMGGMVKKLALAMSYPMMLEEAGADEDLSSCNLAGVEAIAGGCH